MSSILAGVRIDELHGKVVLLQGDGIIDGHRWDFRGKHAEWEFSVGCPTPIGSSEAWEFWWCEPWPEEWSLADVAEARARELLSFGVEAYRDPLARLVFTLQRDFRCAIEDDRELERAWSTSPVWVAVAALAARLAPEQREIRLCLNRFGIFVDEVSAGSPLFGTRYDRFRWDWRYAPSVHGCRDEAELRRALAEALRARIAVPTVRDLVQLGRTLREEDERPDASEEA